MREHRNLHLKVQELCDCYATTDPLREMSRIPNDADKAESALKWLALAALHGINDNASNITVRKSRDGRITVTAEYRRTELPSPGSEAGEQIFAAIREITHIDAAKGQTKLALGLRDSSVELKVKLKNDDEGERFSLKFPT